MENVEVTATAAEVEAFLRKRPTGSGSGSGYGSGSGDGSGDGIKAYDGRKVYCIDDVPTLIDQVRGDLARGSIVRGDLTLDPCFVARSGNSFAHGKTAHDALQDAMAKELNASPLEDRIARFLDTFPDPDAKVAFRDLYTWHHILTGSCTMGRNQFTREHGLDTEGKYTPRYFMTITRNAYGRDAIRQLAAAYGITFDDECST